MSDLKITELPPITNAEIGPLDVIPIVDVSVDTTKKISIGELDLRYSTSSIVRGNIQGINIGVTGGSQAAWGPGVTITLPQPVDVGATVQFLKAVLGELEVDNVKIDAAEITTKGTNVDLTISANGSGRVLVTKEMVVSAILRVDSQFIFTQENNATTGTGVTLALATKSIVNLTGVGLVSVTGIAAASAGRILIYTNKSATPITLINESGTAANQIVTGTGTDLTLEPGASVWLKYDSKYYVIGGSGGGGGGAVASVNGQTGVVVLALDDIDDVVITTLTTDDVLSYDGSNWVNSPRLTNAESDIDDLEAAMGVAQSDISALQSDMAAVEADVATLQSHMTAAEGDITTLQSEMDTAQSDITALQTGKIDKSIFAAKGDILAASANDTPAILTVGTNGQIIEADSAQTAGLKYVDKIIAAKQGLIWWQDDTGTYQGPDITTQLAAVASTLPFPSKYLIFKTVGASNLQYIFTKIKIPADYIAGKNVILKNGRVKVNSTDTSKRILYRAYTRLIKTGDSLATLANTFFTSTNLEIAVGSTANIALALGDINLCDSGAIDSRNLAGGDELWTMLVRKCDSESASVAEDVYLDVDEDLNAFEISFNG